MKLSFGCDHGGLKLKNALIEYAKQKGYEVIDNGTFTEESCDYPIFAKKTANDVIENKADFGVLVCTTGEGIMMTANKVKGIRCAIGYNDEVCSLARRHNNANMISFGQKFTSEEDAKKRLDIFLETEFEGGRHLRRIEAIEK